MSWEEQVLTHSSPKLTCARQREGRRTSFPLCLALKIYIYIYKIKPPFSAQIALYKMKAATSWVLPQLESSPGAVGAPTATQQP